MRIDNGWYIIRARPRDSRLVHPGAGEAADVRTVPELARLATGSVAAVNGGYFDLASGKPLSMVTQRGAVQVPNYRGGDPYIAITGDKASFGAGNAPAGVDWALGGGPMLVDGGRNVCPAPAQIEERYPGTRPSQRIERTAIALTAAGDLLLLITKAATMAEVAAKALQLGAVAALNLDGGGSTSLWYRGEATVGCTRRVANAVAIVAEVEEVAQGYEIKQMLLPIGRNRPGTALTPQGIIIHETATPGATPEDEAQYFAAADRKASAHYFAGPASIVQLIPENEQAWHAGKTANSRYLSIELCHFDGQAQFEETWARAVWLAASICRRHGWAAGPNIYSHKWASETFRETNHTDPYGYFASHGRTFQQFCYAVDATIPMIKDESEVDRLRAEVGELRGQLAADEVVISDLRRQLADRDAVLASIKNLIAQWK